MLEVLDAGVGGLEADVDSEMVDSGSPLVCSTVVAMPRRRTWGASAKRLVARRRAAMVLEWRAVAEVRLLAGSEEC